MSVPTHFICFFEPYIARHSYPFSLMRSSKDLSIDLIETVGELSAQGYLVGALAGIIQTYHQLFGEEEGSGNVPPFLLQPLTKGPLNFA